MEGYNKIRSVKITSWIDTMKISFRILNVDSVYRLRLRTSIFRNDIGYYTAERISRNSYELYEDESDMKHK